MTSNMGDFYFEPRDLDADLDIEWCPRHRVSYFRVCSDCEDGRPVPPIVPVVSEVFLVNPTSLNLSDADVALFKALRDRTGLPRTEIFRRFLDAYGRGAEIPGLPTIKPPLRTE